VERITSTSKGVWSRSGGVVGRDHVIINKLKRISPNQGLVEPTRGRRTLSQSTSATQTLIACGTPRSCPNSLLFNLYLVIVLLLYNPPPPYHSPMNISWPWPLSRFASGSAVSPAVDPTSTLRKPSSIASLLRFYETPGVPPPSSRVDPLLQQRGGHVMSLRDVISLGALVALKGE